MIDMLIGSNGRQHLAAESPFNGNIESVCFGIANIRRGEYTDDCATRDQVTLFDLNIQNVGGTVISGHLCWAAAW